LTLVEHLVRVPSVSGDEAAVAQLLVQQMQQRGFESHVDEAGNAVGRVGAGPLQVYLVGHLDTVPGALPVYVKDDLLFGRGSVDAKGSLAAFVEAAVGLKGSDALSLTVIGCVGEEADSRGAHHVLNTYPPADYVIIGEPSGWDALTLGYKGSLSVEYFLKKPQTHRGAPVSTPAEDAVAFYHALCAAYPQRGYGFEAVSLNLIAFHTDNDGVAETARMYLNVRTPPGFDHSAFEKTVKTATHDAQVEINDPIPAVLAGKQNPLVRALLGGIRAQGARPRFKRKTGTSDMNLLQAWGCPMLAYGPGDSSLDHTPNEHLSLAEYDQSIKVLTHALKNLETV